MGAGVLEAPSIAESTLLGAQLTRPARRKVPPVALVTTRVVYFVRVRMLQAVACAQLHFVSGYSSAPVPIWMTTGALIVTVSGIACATTRQYFSPLL
ncbi:MAG: hypothetical protein ACLR76_12255 [Alistipes sp.]